LNLFHFLKKGISATYRFRGSLFAIPLLIAIFVFGAQITGALQLLEWKLSDQFLRWRPSEGLEPRIVMVTFDEADIAKVEKWPFSDSLVANLITTIKAGNPRVIGLDVYRNLPVETGYAELKRVFQLTPYLIGPEKIVKPSVAAPPDLNYAEQVGFVDVVVDPDGTVRRGLLSIEKTNGDVIYSFAIKIALKYLEAEGISPQLEAGSDRTVNLGKSKIIPFESYQGGYASVDAGGYQTLMNYRCLSDCFQKVSMTEVLAGEYPKDLFKNRIVLIGSIAESLRDFFLSPHGKIPGVFIHANMISQIVNGAIDGRSFLQTYPKWFEGIWVLAWSFIGATGIWGFLRGSGLGKVKFIIGILTFLSLSILGLLGISYISFLSSFWLPILPALCSFLLSSIISIIYLSEQLRFVSNIDELTQIANRRYFDRFLMQNFRKKKDLSIILCDVDYFKLYNDTYGHQAGDECLKQVASAISKATRDTDLAARYGGEEFAVILPNANHEVALRVAERIVTYVRALNVPHSSSKVSHFVTLSCGVASIKADGDFPSLDLLVKADRALYEAKECGRDRVVGYQQ
jgi:adenylate cyclase